MLLVRVFLVCRFAPLAKRRRIAGAAEESADEETAEAAKENKDFPENAPKEGLTAGSRVAPEHFKTLTLPHNVIKQLSSLYFNFYDASLTDSIKQFTKLALEKYPQLTPHQIEIFLRSTANWSVHHRTKSGARNKLMTAQMPGTTIGADIFQLTQYEELGGHKYQLFFIDEISRYTYVIPLADRSTETLTDAFEQFIDEHKEQLTPYVTRFWTDQESGVKTKRFKQMLKTHHIAHIYAYSAFHVSFVEARFTRIRHKILKYLAHTEKGNLDTIIDRIVYAHNRTVNPSTGFSPKTLFYNKTAQFIHFTRTFPVEYTGQVLPRGEVLQSVFKVGDPVRIARRKKVFSKQVSLEDTNYSKTIYIIDGFVNKYLLPRVRLRVIDRPHGAKNATLPRLFYPFELIKIVLTGKYEDIEWEVEKILKTFKDKNGKTMHRVKWKGAGYKTGIIAAESMVVKDK